MPIKGEAHPSQKIIGSEDTSGNEQRVYRHLREAARESAMHRAIVRAGRQDIVDDQNGIRRRLREPLVNPVDGDEFVDRKAVTEGRLVRSLSRLTAAAM
jgi:hypothetical protein